MGLMRFWIWSELLPAWSWWCEPQTCTPAAPCAEWVSPPTARLERAVSISSALLFSKAHHTAAGGTTEEPAVSSSSKTAFPAEDVGPYEVGEGAVGRAGELLHGPASPVFYELQPALQVCSTSTGEHLWLHHWTLMEEGTEISPAQCVPLTPKASWLTADLQPVWEMWRVRFQRNRLHRKSRKRKNALQRRMDQDNSDFSLIKSGSTNSPTEMVSPSSLYGSQTGGLSGTLFKQHFTDKSQTGHVKECLPWNRVFIGSSRWLGHTTVSKNGVQIFSACHSTFQLGV